MYSIFGERIALGASGAAANPGFFRAGLHLFVAFDMESKMIESHGFFLPLVQERQVEIAVGNEIEERSVRSTSFMSRTLQ